MGDIERIENVVSEHAISIALMTKAVSSIESLLTQQTVSIKEIEKAMKSQEILMEKIANLDTRVTDSINRVHQKVDDNTKAIHKRIDKNEADILAMQLENKATCDIVKPMAQKGERVHTGMVFVAKSLGGAVIALILGLIVWAIEQGGAK